MLRHNVIDPMTEKKSVGTRLKIAVSAVIILAADRPVYLTGQAEPAAEDRPCGDQLYQV